MWPHVWRRTIRKRGNSKRLEGLRERERERTAMHTTRSPLTFLAVPAHAFRSMADLVVVLHLAFVLFVVLGGLLVLRWRRLIYLHVPAVIWGAWIEFSGRICPLTPLEKALRIGAGKAAYSGGFIEHYILPVLYPSELTRTIQLVLGAFLIAVNAGIYLHIMRERPQSRLP
jgi:hypothetical protein